MNDEHDPIVEEIRTFRAEHAQRFDGNVAAICDDLRQIQRECQHQIVAFSPKKLQTRHRATSRQKKRERIAAESS